MIWAPDYTQEFARRLRLVKLMRPNVVKNEDGTYTDLNAITRSGIMDHYKNNPVDWIGDWCVTYDPRRPTLKIIPFVLFPRQKEFVQFLYECLNDKESGLVEKCRDMGASWLCCAFAAWLWIFHNGSAIGFGSRKEEYVDEKGNPKAIFPKIRQILEYLPNWMLPEGYSEFKHAPYMKIVNPINGGTITGEAGDNIGRGGRTTMYLKDESAHYERPELVEAALGDNTDVQIDISSVNGSANVFYRRRMAGEIWFPGCKIAKGIVRVFIMDWRDHPLKTQEWYDIRRAKAEREGLLHIFKQEVDRDYSGSIDKIIIPQEWVQAAIDADLRLNLPIVGAKFAGQDVADGGRDKHALVGRHGILLNYAQDWGEGDAGDSVKRTIPICVEHGITELYYDCIGVGSAFKTGINNMKDGRHFPQHLGVYPWDAGAEVINPEHNIIPDDPQSPLNKDFYYNRKAQGWWSLRTRFYKTFKSITQGEKYDPEELISISSKLQNKHKLCMELSQAQYKYAPDGRVLVDKKPDGAMSPNLADATVMCYFPCRELSILDVL